MLLNTNDFKTLNDAMKKRRQITLARSMGSTSVEATTVPLPEAWEHEMGIQVRVVTGGIVWLQTFDNVDAARPMIKSITGA